MSIESYTESSFEQQSSHKIVDPLNQQTKSRFNLFNVLLNSHNSIFLILISIFEAIVVITLETVIFTKFYHTTFSEKSLGLGIPVYLMIFIFSQVFQVFIAWDAVYAQNTIQVISFLLFNICCFVYSIFQFKQIADALNSTAVVLEEAIALNALINRLLIATAVIIGVCQFIYFYIGARLYQEFGWKIYKKIGADPEIRNMYRWYQIILTILKIDFFFFLGYSIQYLVLVLKSGDYEFSLTIAALPFTCLFLLLAVYAIQHESRWLISIFFLGMLAGFAYFVFKIYRIYDPSQSHKYIFVKAFLTFFASVSLVLVVLTISVGFICYLNFGKGLKPHLRNKNNGSSMPQHMIERNLSLE